jgi:hypothetical protein
VLLGEVLDIPTSLVAWAISVVSLGGLYSLLSGVVNKMAMAWVNLKIKQTKANCHIAQHLAHWKGFIVLVLLSFYKKLRNSYTEKLV